MPTVKKTFVTQTPNTNPCHHSSHQREELTPVPGFGFLPLKVVRKAEEMFQVEGNMVKHVLIKT